MQYVKIYLSTAPVIATIWFGLLAGLIDKVDSCVTYMCIDGMVNFKDSFQI